MRSNKPTFTTTSPIVREHAMLIWKKVGRSEFSYQYISDLIQTIQDLQRLKSKDVIVKAPGYATMQKKTALWQFTPRAVEFLKYTYGDVSPEVEHACNEHLEKQYQESVKWARDCRLKTYQKQIPKEEARCVELSLQILGTVPYDRFQFGELRKYGLDISDKDIAIMYRHKFCERTEKNRQYLQLSEKAISAVSDSPIIPLMNGAIPHISLPEPKGGWKTMILIRGATA